MPTTPRGGVVLTILHDGGLANCESVVADRPATQIVSGPEGRPLTISGVTRDSTAAALGGCTVHMFDTATDMEVAQVTSDGSGNYSLPFAYPEYTYYLVAYLAGLPDVSGTTANTLTGT